MSVDEPAIALVFSPESWVEDLHRYCADHGGARICHVVVDPRVALDEDYDTLVVSHRWPALTPAFVAALHERGRRVLGIFDLVEPVGHEHLAGLGVDAVVASDAAMSVFVVAIGELGAASATDRRGNAPETSEAHDLGRVIAVGGTSGAGATEVAIALAGAAALRDVRTALVDVDDHLPAVTQRLALPVEPNLRTAIDSAVHEHGPIELSTVRNGRSFDVLGGLPRAAGWSQVRPEEVLLVLEQLARVHDVVIANVGSCLELVGEAGRDRFGISRSVVAIADAIVGVAAPTPVGVVRAVAWAVELRGMARGCPLHMVVNRAPRDGFRRSELLGELARSVDAASFDVLPEDRRVTDAAWAGQPVSKGAFTRAVDGLAGRLPIGSERLAEVRS